MPRASINAALLLSIASLSNAQYGGGFGGGDNPYSNGGNPGSDGNGDFGPGFSGADFFSRQRILVLAHAVLACFAFAFFFPVGGIMIRLGSFPGLWIVHGMFQIFAYVLYIAAFAIGVYMATNLHLMSEAHVIIGIVLLVVLFLQPISGFIHHFAFKKNQRRGLFSYAHIWLGRAIITAGIVNGGLGLQLAQRLPFAPPSTGAVIGYSIIAGMIWLVYFTCAVIGEMRRARPAPPPYREPKHSHRRRQYA